LANQQDPKRWAAYQQDYASTTPSSPTRGDALDRQGPERISDFVAGNRIKPLVSQALENRLGRPRLFVTPHGHMAHGGDAATVLEERGIGMPQDRTPEVRAEQLAARFGLAAHADALADLLARSDEEADDQGWFTLRAAHPGALP
jgi:hypothetical protein